MEEEEPFSHLKAKRHHQWLNKLREQAQARELLSLYAPWGRPGCGAPDPEARERRRRRFLGEREHLFVRGGGVDVGLGGGGCGAPIRTRSGRIITKRHADPLLLFQPQPPLRKCVEEGLRYRSSVEAKTAYRQQLDDMVGERRKAEAEEQARALAFDRLLGWTNGDKDGREEHLRKSPEEHRAKSKSCGVELVPLLVERRIPNKSHPRCTTDITSGRSYAWGEPSSFLQEKKKKELQYLEELNRQVETKHRRMQELRKEELASCIRHSERWQQIWSSEPRRQGRAARCSLLPRRRAYGLGDPAALLL